MYNTVRFLCCKFTKGGGEAALSVIMPAVSRALGFNHNVWTGRHVHETRRDRQFVLTGRSLKSELGSTDNPVVMYLF